MKKSALKVLLWLITALAGFLLILTAVSLFIYLLEPTSPPQNVTIANTTNSQASISWTSKIPTRGAMIVSSDGKFPLLPIFINNLEKDDGEKDLKTMRLYLTHHVTIGALEEDKTYQFRIYQGLRMVYQGSFKTGPILVSISAPNPVYGRVVKADGKTGEAGALVYLWSQREASKSAFLSTITNTTGRWSLDLANLRSLDFRNGFLLSADTQEILLVDNGKGKKALVETKFGLDKPWPDVVLK